MNARGRWALQLEGSWSGLGGRRAAGRRVRPAAALVLVALCLGCGSEDAPEASVAAHPPQRILLITIDTLRADRVGFAGYPRMVTPHLDRLAAEGVVFDRAFSSIAHTAPSHASMFTGLQPAQHGLLENGTILDDALVTIAEHLSGLGFRTAAFTPVRFVEGLSHGFEEFESADGYSPAPEVLSRARSWIDRQSTGQSLFAWIHLFDVHEWYRDRFVDREALRELRERDPLTDRLVDHLRERQGLLRDGAGGAQAYRTQNLYDAQIVSVDRSLGGFLEGLRADGLDRRSLWIVTSDHGEGLGNHGHDGHGHHVYDELLRVPLLFHWPDRDLPRRRVETTVRLVDLAPTIAELVAAPLPQAVPVDGRSLVPLLDGEPIEWDEIVFSQRRPADRRRVTGGWIPGEIRGLRTPTEKLVEHSDGLHEFYRLEWDPLELENRYDPDDVGQRSLLDELQRRHRVMAAQGSPFVAKRMDDEIVLEELRALGYVAPD